MIDANPFKYSIGTRVRDRIFLRMLELAPQDSVIDIGCGLGYFTNLIAQTASCIGVDIDQSCISHCQKHLKGTYLLSDVRSLPFSDEVFDKAICTEVLEHFEDPGEVLRETRRILRPRGTLIASVPCSAGVFGSRIKNIGHANVDENSLEYHHHKGFTLSQFRKLLSDNGFRTVDHQYTLVLIAELIMGATKLVVGTQLKHKINSQANALPISRRWYWKLYRWIFPALLVVGDLEQPLSRWLHGHMLIIKAVKENG